MFSFTEKILSSRIILDLLLVIIYSVWILQQVSISPIDQIDFAVFMGLLALASVAAGVVVERALSVLHKKEATEDVRDAEIRLRGNSMTLHYIVIVGSGIVVASFVYPDLFLLVHLMFFGGVGASIFNSASRIYLSRFGVLV
jgi:hypothetical protein